jgi:hypothetical protein
MRGRSRDESALGQLQAEIICCTRCPQLTRHREEVTARKVRRYRDWEYCRRDLYKSAFRALARAIRLW